MKAIEPAKFRSMCNNVWYHFHSSSCIDKDECGPALLNDRNYFFNQFDSQMTCPWIFFNFIGDDGFYFNSLFDFGPDNYTASPPPSLSERGASKTSFAWFKISDGSTDTPDRDGVRSRPPEGQGFFLLLCEGPGMEPLYNSATCQLHLYSSLTSNQFMPFVNSNYF